METLFNLLWWALILGAAWQARKAWGTGTGIGTVLGLYLLAVLPGSWVGWLLSAGFAVAVGARAENAQARSLTLHRAG